MQKFPFEPLRGATLTELLLVLGVIGFLSYKGLKHYSKTHVPEPKVFESGTMLQNIEALSVIKPTWGAKLTPLRPQVENSKTRPSGLALIEVSKKIATVLGANPQNVIAILGDGTLYNESGQLKRRIIVGGRLVAGLSTKLPEEFEQFQSIRQFEGYLVVRADGTNFRVNFHGQRSSAHIWRNPTTGLVATVFFTYPVDKSRKGEQMPSALVVDEESWKADFHLDSCLVPHEPGIPATVSGDKCLTGIVTDPKGNKMSLTYGYFTDWGSRINTRIVMGGQQMVSLAN